MLTNVTQDTNSALLHVQSLNPVTVYCWGEFDGAVVEFLIGPDKHHVQFVAQTFTAEGFWILSHHSPFFCRARVTNAGPATNINFALT